jgi:hypothetical protein
MTVAVFNDIVSGLLSMALTVAGQGAPSISTRAIASTMKFPAVVVRIRTEGYALPDDGGGGYHNRAPAAPSHGGFFPDADGAIWVLDEEAVTLEQFGGGKFAPSNTDALNLVIGYCAATDCRTIRARVGFYTFATKPADITCKVKIVGPGSSSCNWVRAYSEAGGNDVGFITLRQTTGGAPTHGSGLAGIMLSAADSTTGGTMLHIVTDGQINGYTTLDDLVITYSGSGAYQRCIYVDGVLNATAGGQGYRDLRITRSYFFTRSQSDEAARFRNAVNLEAQFWTNGKTVVWGGGTATTNSTNARLTLISLSELFIGNSARVTTYGDVNSLIHSTGSTQCRHWGLVGAGGYSNSGGDPTCKVIN